jgi:hypothetical protein
VGGPRGSRSQLSMMLDRVCSMRTSALFWTDLRHFVYVMWICVATSHVCVVTSLNYGCVETETTSYILYMFTSVCLIPIGTIKIYVFSSANSLTCIAPKISIVLSMWGLYIFISDLLFSFDLMISVGPLVGIVNYVVEPFVSINLWLTVRRYL